MTRLLLIEDSPTQAEHLKIILESQGYNVQVAMDGLQGWELLQSSTFDLVLSDIVMPGLTGYEVCRKIKGDPLRKCVPVILLTTLKDPMDVIQGLECGADNFITKPYEPEYLLGRIQGVLKSKVLRAEGKLKIGAEISFLGRTFTVTSDKEQILDLLLSTFEEIVRSNEALQATQAELTSAKARVEEYARQLEGRARSSEEKYRKLMESANDGIFLLSPEGKIQEINRRWEDLVGCPRSQIIHRECDEFVVPAQRAALRRSLQELSERQSAKLEQVRLERTDKRAVYADLSMSLQELNGEQIILVIAHDISGRRSLEEQLRQSQKMEAVGRLAGGIAHDFNNLLTVISGYSEFLMSRLSQGDSNRAMVQEIFASGKRAAALTSQLLAFSRQQTIAPKILDLNVVLRDVERMLSRLIGEDVQLHCALDDTIGKVEIDPGQMEQVVLNLIVNARDAMPKGGRLTIETSNVELDGSWASLRPGVQPGPYVMLAVSDTGCGMSEETQARIFEPFFTTKEVGKGTGLGLATVYGIVNQSGGHIFVYSELGLGTTFKIFLPRVQSKVPAQKPPSVYLPCPRGTETILIVEDEPAVRLLTRQALEASGYTVLEAGGGHEALRLCSAHPGQIHLLVTDVVMAQISGRELASEITASRPETLVLFVSGYTNDTIVRHGVLVGEAEFLQKPFTPGILCRKVREVLDKKKPAVAPQSASSG